VHEHATTCLGLQCGAAPLICRAHRHSFPPGLPENLVDQKSTNCSPEQLHPIPKASALSRVALIQNVPSAPQGMHSQTHTRAHAQPASLQITHMQLKCWLLACTVPHAFSPCRAKPVPLCVQPACAPASIHLDQAALTPHARLKFCRAPGSQAPPGGFDSATVACRWPHLFLLWRGCAAAGGSLGCSCGMRGGPQMPTRLPGTDCMRACAHIHNNSSMNECRTCCILSPSPRVMCALGQQDSPNTRANT